MSYFADYAAFHCAVYFCENESAFKKTIKNLNVKNNIPYMGKGDATTHILEKNGIITLVCFPVKTLRARPNKNDIRKTFTLMCHEAVHVWQAIKENLGEEKPGNEIEAYAVQSITDFLCWCVQQELKKRRV